MKRRLLQEISERGETKKKKGKKEKEAYFLRKNEIMEFDLIGKQQTESKYIERKAYKERILKVKEGVFR